MVVRMRPSKIVYSRHVYVAELQRSGLFRTAGVQMQAAELHRDQRGAADAKEQGRESAHRATIHNSIPCAHGQFAGHPVQRPPTVDQCAAGRARALALRINTSLTHPPADWSSHSEIVDVTFLSSALHRIRPPPAQGHRATARILPGKPAEPGPVQNQFRLAWARQCASSRRRRCRCCT